MPYLGGEGRGDYAVLFGALSVSSYVIHVFRIPFLGVFLLSLLKINTCI